MPITKQVLEFLALIVGLTFVFSLLGVYGTGDLPFQRRLFFWGVTIATGSLSGYLLAPVIWSDRLSDWPDALKIVLTAAAVSIPVTLVLFLIGGWPGRVLYAIIQFGYVMVISLIISIGMYAADRIKNQAQALETADPDPTANFLQRLPVKYRTATLYAIASEDHYLRVYTSFGEELILLRLADALRELAGADGLQVHRSWWIARAGISDERRGNGRSVLVLPSGTEIPVSRSYRAKAKEAGFIR